MAKMASKLSCLHSVGVLSNLNDLRQHRDLCDVNLKVGDCVISAHKVVLSACSPYFKAMFTQEMQEKSQSNIVFHCINIESMKTLIDFAYTGQLEVSAANVQSLVPVACLFQMKLVIDECSQFLESQIHINNCVGIWRFADAYGLSELCQGAMKFIHQNFEEVAKYDEIFDLPFEDLTMLLCCDDLNVASEESVVEVLEAWVLWDMDVRKHRLPELLKCIRIPLLRPDFFDTNSKLSQLIKDNSLAQSILQNSLQNDCSVPDGHQVRPRCAPKALCAVGGKNGLFATLASFEIYFPEANEWRSMTSLPQPRYECCAVVTDRKLYVLGGIVCEPYRQHSNSVIVWDAKKNIWACSTNMSKRRSSFGTVVIRGNIYALGGYDGDAYLRHMEKYLPRKRVWERLPDMRQARTSFSAVALQDCIYAIGGYGLTHYDSVEMYDINTRCWQEVRPMLNKRINFGVVVLNDAIYVMGGHSGEVHLNSMEKYDRRQKEWTPCRPMPRRRTGIGTAVIDGKVYVVGGHSGHEYLDVVFSYDPVTEKWSECQSMSSARCNFALAAL